MTVGPKYAEYQRLVKQSGEIAGWIAHIGAKGRERDVLELSVGHAAVKLVIAGQYSTGDNNYRESPASFNALLLDYIHENFPAIRDAIVKKAKERENAAKIATRGELQAALDAIPA